jgi:hypothetical protein
LSLRDKRRGAVPFPGNKLPGYFQLSLRDKRRGAVPFPGNKLPGYFQLSLRDRKNPFLMNPYSYIKSV